MKLAIGIDPDVDLNGFGIWNAQEREMQLLTLDLFDTFMKLIELNLRNDITVYLEAGWLVKGMWHKGGIGAAKKVGSNAEIGRQIEKFMRNNDIKYHLVKPPGYSQYSHQTFCKITGWNPKVRTNSEKRVAGLLCFGK